MRNLWNEAETAGMDDLDLLVYQSRLIGADPSLVVWGGGNTSIKANRPDLRGRDTNVIIIKGSGSDMKSIERKHFPSLRLDDVLSLFERQAMSDEEMVDYLNKWYAGPQGAQALHRDPAPRLRALQQRGPLPCRCIGCPHKQPRRRSGPPDGLWR